MKRLFNNDGSVNDDGSQVNMMCERLARELVEYANENDLSLRDVQVLMLSRLDMSISRALVMLRRTIHSE